VRNSCQELKLTYYPHCQEEINEMLSVIGLKDINDLKKPVPEKYILKKEFKFKKIEGARSELEVFDYFKKLSDANREYSSIFLGAGAYNHFIPSAVDEITSRQEFYTAYTPYQPEIAQGTLQAIFEYQTYITDLAGLDVSNASLYDGATALAESVIMSVKITGKNKVLVDKYIHPEYLTVLRTYLNPINIKIEIYNSDPFFFNADDFKKHWSKDFASFVIQSPNYCGTLNDLSRIADTVHNDKSLFIQNITEPMSLAILKSPGEYNADIACGEAQSFGMPLSFGGPYLGFITCKKDCLRKMPGRIAGQTEDADGKIAYVLTLSAREQHIRRDNATSNICSNHGLCALRASVYFSLLGKNGIRTCALKNMENAQNLRNKIKKSEKFNIIGKQIFFNEFAVKTDIKYEKINKILEKENILSFLPLSSIDQKLKNHYLLCATEMNTNEQIDNFTKVLEKIK